MKKEPVKNRELDALTRSSSFQEVALGYSEEEALAEASRCLQCKNPVCISGCPVGIDIKKFISQITEKDYKSAYRTIKEKNNFPAICGRVCPAEYQCRKACVLTKKDAPFASDNAINIHLLERFIGDYAIENGLSKPETTSSALSDKKVAIVGSGPAGLCCAGELSRSGIQTVLFESLHKTGGVLRYGIPSFRLPQKILDFEIDYLKKAGVEIKTNIIIGKTKTLDALFDDGFDAVFLGLGAGVPGFLGISGENLCNVYSANEFLTRTNLMNAFKFPEFHTPINIGKNIVIVGGGNTAMDAARVALRLQKKLRIEDSTTTIIYRRTEVEMPARRPEIEHAKEEGVQFKFLVQPTEFSGDENGYINKIKCLLCELGTPDDSGRRRSVPVKNSEFLIDCDIAIEAVGLNANTLLTGVTPQIKTDKWGDVIVDKETMLTSVKNVYAGGDIVGGEGTVIEAMGMAKKAAKAIVEKLKNC